MAKRRHKAKKKNPKRAAKKRAPKRSNPKRRRARAAAPKKRASPRRRRHATRSNPAPKRRRRHHARRRNPGTPDALVSVAKAVGGGIAAAGIVAGVMAIGQKFPMTKAKAVALQGVGAVVGGATLAALGAPGAGAVVAATLTGTAIATAQVPTVADTSKTSGVLPQRHVSGLLNEGDRAAMVSGILARRRADMAR